MYAVLEFFGRWGNFCAAKAKERKSISHQHTSHHRTARLLPASVDCWCLLFVKWKLENSSENRSWAEWIRYLERGRAWELRMLLLFLIWFHTFRHEDTRNENLIFFNLIRLDRKPQKWTSIHLACETLSNVEWHSIKEDGSTCAIINWTHSRAKSSWKFHAPLCSRVFNSISSGENGFDLDGKFLELWQLHVHVQSQSVRYWINLTTIRFVSLPLYWVSIFFCSVLMSKLFMIVEWNDMRAEKIEASDRRQRIVQLI